MELRMPGSTVGLNNNDEEVIQPPTNTQATVEEPVKTQTEPKKKVTTNRRSKSESTPEATPAPIKTESDEVGKEQPSGGIGIRQDFNYEADPSHPYLTLVSNTQPEWVASVKRMEEMRNGWTTPTNEKEMGKFKKEIIRRLDDLVDSANTSDEGRNKDIRRLATAIVNAPSVASRMLLGMNIGGKREIYNLMDMMGAYRRRVKGNQEAIDNDEDFSRYSYDRSYSSYTNRDYLHRRTYHPDSFSGGSIYTDEKTDDEGEKELKFKTPKEKKVYTGISNAYAKFGLHDPRLNKVWGELGVENDLPTVYSTVWAKWGENGGGKLPGTMTDWKNVNKRIQMSNALEEFNGDDNINKACKWLLSDLYKVGLTNAVIKQIDGTDFYKDMVSKSKGFGSFDRLFGAIKDAISKDDEGNERSIEEILRDGITETNMVDRNFTSKFIAGVKNRLQEMVKDPSMLDVTDEEMEERVKREEALIERKESDKKYNNNRREKKENLRDKVFKYDVKNLPEGADLQVEAITNGIIRSLGTNINKNLENPKIAPIIEEIKEWVETMVNEVTKNKSHRRLVREKIGANKWSEIKDELKEALIDLGLPTRGLIGYESIVINNPDIWDRTRYAGLSERQIPEETTEETPVEIPEVRAPAQSPAEPPQEMKVDRFKGRTFMEHMKELNGLSRDVNGTVKRMAMAILNGNPIPSAWGSMYEQDAKATNWPAELKGVSFDDYVAYLKKLKGRDEYKKFVEDLKTKK